LEKPSRSSLLGRLHRSLSLAAPRELWQKGLWTAIVGAAIGILFFAYRRRGIAGAALTVGAGLILAIVALFFTSANQEHSAAKYYADSAKVSAPHAGGAQWEAGGPQSEAGAVA